MYVHTKIYVHLSGFHGCMCVVFMQFQYIFVYTLKIAQSTSKCTTFYKHIHTCIYICIHCHPLIYINIRKCRSHWNSKLYSFYLYFLFLPLPLRLLFPHTFLLSQLIHTHEIVVKCCGEFVSFCSRIACTVCTCVCIKIHMYICMQMNAYTGHTTMHNYNNTVYWFICIYIFPYT